MHDLEHILAFAPNWLGDAVMCTPALRALHARFPRARLSVAGRGAVCDLLRGLPYVSELHCVPSRAGLIEMVRQGWKLRNGARDMAVVFPHSFRAALQAFFTGARERAGYDRGGRSWLMTRRVPPNRVAGRIEPVYMVEEYLGLVAALGCEDDRLGPELAAAPEAVAAVRERVGDGRPLIGFAPGAAFGPSKCWPAERYAMVAETLTETLGAHCLLLTGPGEEATRDAVRRAAPKAHFVDWQGGQPTLETLKAAISQLGLLIGNDSGPRHMAIAFHVPVVCIMGPTSPRYTEGPYEKGTLLRVDAECGPCQKPICEQDFRCMTAITAEQVVEAAQDVLKI